MSNIGVYWCVNEPGLRAQLAPRNMGMQMEMQIPAMTFTILRLA